MKSQHLLALPLSLLMLAMARPALAAPVSPEISITVTPEQLRPAEAGMVFIGGAYPLEISVTLDGQPLDVFWAGDSYRALFSFPFDALPGERLVEIVVDDPASGLHLEETRSILVIYYEFPAESVNLPAILIDLLNPAVNEAENQRLSSIFAARSNGLRANWPFILPVPAGQITSMFGGDRSYNGGLWQQYHAGTDFKRLVGEPVLAAGDGWVAAAEDMVVRGGTVVIDHGHGVFTLYAHLSAIFVSPGDQVVAGAMIGSAGNTGRTIGPHLHFELIVNGLQVDPIGWYGISPGFETPAEIPAIRGANPEESTPEPAVNTPTTELPTPIPEASSTP